MLNKLLPAQDSAAGVPGGNSGGTSSKSAGVATVGELLAELSSPADTPIAFMFPGQGSQALGMLTAATAKLPAVANMLRIAQEVLGYDVLQLCTTGELLQLQLWNCVLLHLVASCCYDIHQSLYQIGSLKHLRVLPHDA